jgi:hypothetical protein
MIKVKMHVEKDIEMEVSYPLNIHDEISKWEQEHGLKDSVVYFEYNEPFVVKINDIDLGICIPDNNVVYTPEAFGYVQTRDAYNDAYLYNPKDSSEKMYFEGDTIPFIERE